MENMPPLNNTAENNGLAEDEEEMEFDVVMQEWLMALEETRRLISLLKPSSSSSSSSITLVQHVQACQRGLEHVHALAGHYALLLPRSMPSLSHDAATTTTNHHDEATAAAAQWAMIQHASQKSQHLSWDVLQHVTTVGWKKKPSSIIGLFHNNPTSTETDPEAPEGKQAVQACVARIMELTLLLHQSPHPHPSNNNDGMIHNNNDTIATARHHPSMEDISSVYAQYQRKVLRQRSKDAILSLGNVRNQCQSNGMTFGDYYWTLLLQQQQQLQQQQDDDDDDDNPNNDSNSQSFDLLQQQPHGHAIMIILSEASSLIHPLQAWNRSVGPVRMTNDDTKEETVAGGSWSMPNAIQTTCDKSVQLLHAEAQSLALTVLEWLVQDCDILKWNQTISQQQRSASDDDDEPGDNPAHANPNNLGRLDAILEEMALCCQVVSRYCTFVTQEAICVESPLPTSSKSTSTSTSTLEGQLQELSFYYSTLETYLMEQNFAQAMELATPVEIVVGRPNLLLPSVVEDALYMCTRAMDRAAGTLVDRALWTVGHWVCQLWSIPNHHQHDCLSITTILTRATSSASTTAAATADSIVQTGVYKALLMDGRGCFVDPTAMEAQFNATQASSPNHSSTTAAAAAAQPPNSGSFFASALLEALDQDLGDGPIPPAAPMMEHTQQKRSSAPSSGGLFSSGMNKLHQQAAMDAEMCTLNGIHSASTACMTLSTLFQTYLEQPPDDEDENDDDPSQINGATTKSKQQIMNPSLSKLQFAQEELESHSKSYRDILSQQCREVIAKWCGNIIDDLGSSSSSAVAALCFHRVNSFVQQERYNLNGTDFSMAESEARLQQELVNPIQNCRLFQQVLLGKCDPQVSLSIAKEMSSVVANDIYLSTLLQGNETLRFTDWGSLLLSKQVRLLQDLLCSLVLDNSDAVVNTSAILSQFERLNQAVTLLQLEKPSDWTVYYSSQQPHVLTTTEIQTILSLRVDFKR